MHETRLVKASPRVVRSTFEAFGALDLPPGVPVELALRARIEGVPLRDVAAYLWIVDRLYGRLDPRGLRSYSQKTYAQLKVKETRSGSIEVIFSEALGHVNPQSLLILWLLLRGLPYAGRAVSEAVGNYARAFREVEEGRLARARRRRLEGEQAQDAVALRLVRREMRAFLEADPRFSGLARERRNEIARLLSDAYIADADQVRGIRRFAEQNVEGVVLRLGELEFSD